MEDSLKEKSKWVAGYFLKHYLTSAYTIMKTNAALKIFVVDDDTFSLHKYEQLLRNLGYSNITLFNNGQACIENLSRQPEIIFLDHEMEKLNGVEVLKKIKQFNTGIYVVFVSGQEDVQTAVNSLKFGAFDYIVKDDNDTGRIEQVLARIRDVMELVMMNRKSIVF